MAINEITGIVAPIAAAVVLAAGLGWQLMRRKTVKPKKSREVKRISVDRRTENGSPVPNENPSQGAVERNEAVRAFESIGVRRPTMLAITTIRGDATAAEVFVQRAFKIDRQYWRELNVTLQEKKSLSCLFANACKLAWVPGSAFERHIFAVSFAPILEEALKQGYHPRVNATAADLQVCAIDETGTQLGEPMLMPDHSWGAPARVHGLWCALNPSDKPHELADELKKEVATLKERVEGLKQYVSAVTARTWQQRMDEIEDLAHDMRRLNTETGPAGERNDRTDEIVNRMLDEAKRIDELVAERTKTVKNVEDADNALVHAIAYMHVRELTVRVLRVCALLRVIGGDKFELEIRSANRITMNVSQFTDVRPLIATAESIVHDTLASGESRSMADSHVEQAGSISRHAKELLKTHDELVEALRQEALSVQEQIDKYLLLQTRPRRYAVRVDDYGNIESMFVLEV